MCVIEGGGCSVQGTGEGAKSEVPQVRCNVSPNSTHESATLGGLDTTFPHYCALRYNVCHPR
jgi:hypothetical protein